MNYTPTQMSYKGQWRGEPLKAKPKGVLLSSPAGCETVATECFHSPFLPFLIKVCLIYNIVLISGVQQGASF